MKKLAARDLEDLLQVEIFLFIMLVTLIVYTQCAIPVFEGLLPQKYDMIVQKLLFEMATWHGLAKLRLHTDSTLTNLETSSTRLCDLLRKFKTEVCSAFITQELPSEEAARGRRKAAMTQKTAESEKAVREPKTLSGNNPKLRTFNMETYKLHGLPDVPAAIRAFGVTENTSTKNVWIFFQVFCKIIDLTISQGESEHKRSKQFYSRVRKGDHVRGIARHVYRERTLLQAHQAMKKRAFKLNENQCYDVVDQDAYTLNIPLGEEEVLGPTPPEDHHQISKDVRHKVDVLKWLAENKNDPALTVSSSFYSSF